MSLQTMQKDKKNKHSYFEWIQLIISFSIPIIIVIYTVLKNKRDIDIAANNRAHDLQIADNQQKEIVLREYQKILSRLFENYGPQLNESSFVSLVARFATLSALDQLDPARRSFLIRLLYDAELINYQSISDQPVISLESANLLELCLTDGTAKANYHKVSFEWATMTQTNLNSFQCDFCSFSLAEMPQTDIRNAEILNSLFSMTSLRHAEIHTSKFGENADFSNADMTYANITYNNFTRCQFDFTRIENANFQYNTITNSTFTGAKMSGTSILHSIFIDGNFTNDDMSKSNWRNVVCERCIFTLVNFNDTNSSNGIFIESDFRDSMITDDQLNQTTSLKGSRLPNGTVINYK